MEIVKRIGRMRELVRDMRARGETLALVPTMGYLHDGHLALARLGREMAARVVMSVYVNPKQFGPGEDLAAYPRDLARDAELATRERIDYLFVPEDREIYPDGFRTHVEVEGLGSLLCGRTRPGHFRGVATVVTKLLAIVDPDFVVFGQKDAQQLVIVRRLVKDLNLRSEIVAMPTVREPDGLAMSSRNVRLDPAERRAAVVLSRALSRGREAWEGGERRGRGLADALLRTIAEEPLARLDYAEAVDPETLEPVAEARGAVLLVVAAWVGPVRLIDNILLGG